MARCHPIQTVKQTTILEELSLIQWIPKRTTLSQGDSSKVEMQFVIYTDVSTAEAQSWLLYTTNFRQNLKLVEFNR